jgi:hypothetical protein
VSFDPITAALDLGTKLIDKFIPDPVEKEKAKLEMLRAQQDGHMKDIEVQLSAIIAEAKSADPWTSRARPSFLYVMYIFILAAIPMGIISVFSPASAVAVAEGMKAWLNAVPDMLWGVFGTGYLGYTVARSAWDKKK